MSAVAHVMRVVKVVRLAVALFTLAAIHICWHVRVP